MARIHDASDAIEEVTNNGYYLEATGDGILLVANERKIQLLRAAGSAAIIEAENTEARHGQDCELAKMYRAANDFVEDVARFSRTDADEDGTLPAARGRYADLTILHSAIGLRHESDHGGSDDDPMALHFLTQLHDRAYRQLKFRDAGARMEQVGHDYKP